MDDELVLVCGKNHRFASLSAVPPQTLESEAFIVREKGSGTRKTFEDVMTAHHLSWKAAWACNNSDSIKAAVIAGLGVTVISRMAIEKEVKEGELIISAMKVCTSRVNSRLFIIKISI